MTDSNQFTVEFCTRCSIKDYDLTVHTPSAQALLETLWVRITHTATQLFTMRLFEWFKTSQCVTHLLVVTETLVAPDQTKAPQQCVTPNVVSLHSLSKCSTRLMKILLILNPTTTTQHSNQPFFHRAFLTFWLTDLRESLLVWRQKFHHTTSVKLLTQHCTYWLTQRQHLMT